MELRRHLDQTADGQRLKLRTVLGEYTCQGLELLSAAAILRLGRHYDTAPARGAPGPVAVSEEQSLTGVRVQARSIEGGGSWQNSHTESFHAVLRDRCLKC